MRDCNLVSTTNGGTCVYVTGTGVFAEVTGLLNISGVTGTTYGVLAQNASSVDVHDLTVLSSAATTYGIDNTSTGATIVGSGVDTSACSTPFSVGTTGSFTQNHGVFTETALTGGTALSTVQARAISVIQTGTGTLTGAVLDTIPAGMPGLTYVVVNNLTGLGGFTYKVGVAGGASVSIPINTRHVILYSDGTNMVQASAFF